MRLIPDPIKDHQDQESKKLPAHHNLSVTGQRIDMYSWCEQTASCNSRIGTQVGKLSEQEEADEPFEMARVELGGVMGQHRSIASPEDLIHPQIRFGGMAKHHQRGGQER